MKGKKISVSELKDIEILYKGDIYELACLLLKLYDAKDAGTNARSRHTVYGLAAIPNMACHASRERVSPKPLVTARIQRRISLRPGDSSLDGPRRASLGANPLTLCVTSTADHIWNC